MIVLINAKEGKVALYRKVNSRPPAGYLTEWDLEAWLQSQNIGAPMVVFLSAGDVQKKYSVFKKLGVQTNASTPR